ncbi:zinc metalloprotease [Actinorhabdospora filicis]|uniref:Zinc metalloprotease n=1 Tax=Actinorhabdospora filicis TaxID=1785913 RepID=A0A9W6SMR8_9ACTN|nr:M4 family metallopeptidase [Actinorhabdospora filicis]GLZ78750.1 zinc metalloprotease [Actinorhabdospora filicis]
MRRTLVAAAALGLCAGVTLSAVASADPRPAATPQANVLAVAAQAADAYVNSRAADLYVGSHDTFQRVKSEHSLGLNFISYERAYDGIPVVGGDFVIATNDAGTVLYTSVAQTAKLSLADTKADRSAKDSTAEDALATARLVVFAHGDAPALAYVSQVAGVDEDGAPILRSIYTDADSGKELAVYDDVKAGTGNTYYNGRPGTVQFGTSPNSPSGYIMRDAARPGLSCAPQGGAVYTDADDTWGTGTGTDLVTACVDAMYAAGQEWDMLAGWVGRNGINGTGGAFPLFVNLNDVNAYWNGSSATFGHSQDNQRQLTSIDIVSHELGHAIFQTTPGGSSGGNETGGINEGTGDIFGALTEWWDNQPVASGNDSPDYLVGEAAGLLTPGAPIRNMPNPGAEGDPNCWSTSIPSTEVHAAAGPINHWFYLTAEGTAPGGAGKPGSTTCNSTTIPAGVGIASAGKIWMGALNGKNSSWTYAQARKAALNFAATSPVFATCTEYNIAKAAFDGVSVPGGSDPVCSKNTRDFDFGISPASGSVQPGGSASATIATTNVGTPQTVSFSATVSPAQTTISATVTPSSVTTPGSATLNVTTTAATPQGTYTITVVGTGETGTKSRTYSLTVSTVTQPTVIFGDDFSTNKGWTVNAGGTDTATAGKWERGDPAATSYSGTTLQRNDCATESTCLVTGAAAGTDAGTYDVDGGTTTITSPAIAVPGGKAAKISLKYYLAHLNNASSADGFKVTITAPGIASKVVVNVPASAVNKAGAWLALSNADISEFAGATIRIVVSATDASTGSLIEAAVDDVQVVSG